jgi:hypothetical protein
MLNFPHKVTDIFIRCVEYNVDENLRPYKIWFFNIYPDIVSLGHVVGWLDDGIVQNMMAHSSP